MAKICDNFDWDGWAEWIATRPACIQALAQRLPPDLLYRMKSTGHRVFLYSYSEDNTVTVCVTGKYNFVTFDRRVFGVDPDDLTECELPEPGERIGTMFTEKAEVRQFIELVRLENKESELHGSDHGTTH